MTDRILRRYVTATLIVRSEGKFEAIRKWGDTAVKRVKVSPAGGRITIDLILAYDQLDDFKEFVRSHKIRNAKVWVESDIEDIPDTTGLPTFYHQTIKILPP